MSRMANAYVLRYRWTLSAVLVFVAAVHGPAAGQHQVATVGYVVDASDQMPIRGARLSIAAAATPSANALATTVTTDHGGFELPPVDVNGILTVAAAGYATQRLRWPRGAVEIPVKIELEKVAKLTLHVRDQRGAFLPAIVSVTTQHPGNYIQSAGATPSGVLTFGDLASGVTTIVARAQGYAPGMLTVQVDSGREYGPLDLRLVRARAISGIVIDSDGDPIPGATVDVGYGPEVPSGRTFASFVGGRLRTRQDGRFWVTGVVPNAPVIVSARRDASAPSPAAVSVLPGKEDTNILIVLP